MAEVDPLIGAVLDGYRVVELIGRGGVANVYRVVGQSPTESYALKVFVGPGAEDEAMTERFLREARAMRRIAHPNVIRLFGYGIAEAPYLVLEWVEGESLAEAVKTMVLGHPVRVIGIARQIASGLEAIHRAGFIHRDLKPHNVMLCREGHANRIKIVDFGLVSSSAWTRVTGTGALVGTPIYMAPEVLQGEAATERSDLYGLGLILYELLTGAPPFSEEEFPAVLTKRVFHAAPPLPELGGLEVLVHSLLERDPARRPVDAGSVVAVLDALADKFSAEEAAGAVTEISELADTIASTSGVGVEIQDVASATLDELHDDTIATTDDLDARTTESDELRQSAPPRTSSDAVGPTIRIPTAGEISRVTADEITTRPVTQKQTARPRGAGSITLDRAERLGRSSRLDETAPPRSDEPKVRLDIAIAAFLLLLLILFALLIYLFSGAR